MRQLAIVSLVGLLATTSSFKEHGHTPSGKQLTSNPFFAASTLPYQAPAFNKIKDTDFKPALEEGMKEQLKEIQQIANHSAAPTFENTFVAMEKSGQMYNRVN